MNDSISHRQSRSGERGSVLWIILIALVLIGLLTAVLSRSGTSVEQSGDVEQQSIKISKMLRYTKGLETTIQQMKLRGISESDLNFDPAAANSANCTTNDCKVFHVDGGGLSHQAPPIGVSTSGASWKYIATNNVLNVGTTAPDLILMLDYVGDSICGQINRQLSVTKGASDSDIDLTDFVGAYTATATIDNAGGKASGCQIINDGGTARNFFYQVLVAR